MLGDKEIYDIAAETHYEFSINYLIECKFEVLLLEKFIKQLEKNGLMVKLIQNKIIEGPKDLNLVVFTLDGEPNKMFICKTVFNRIVKKFSNKRQKLFLQAIVLHELCHALSNTYDRNVYTYGFVMSTEDGLDNLKDEYPDSFKLLDEGKKVLQKVAKKKKK